MLGGVKDIDDLQLAERLVDHPSCLGWLAAPDLLDRLRGAHGTALRQDRLLVGVETDPESSDQCPPGVHFLIRQKTIHDTHNQVLGEMEVSA